MSIAFVRTALTGWIGNHTRSVYLFEGLAGLHANLLENLRSRTKSGNGRLQQVGAHKSCEPEPVRAVHLGQQQAEKNHKPPKGKYRSIYIHDDLLFVRNIHIKNILWSSKLEFP